MEELDKCNSSFNLVDNRNCGGGSGDDGGLRPDPRVDGWLLMSSPWPTLYMIAGYVVMVTLVGPWFMKNRKPYDLRTTLVIYSGAQMLFSAWQFYKLGQAGWFHSYSFTCQPIDRSTSEMAMRMVHACWWYYFSKLTEFCDTLFFVLRKKNEHISALHVFHHGVMPMIWVGVKFSPGGHLTFFTMLNTFVHIVMYFYYMMSAMGPRFAKYLWWKKYLTVMQITQFIIGSIHALPILFFGCEAGYPKSFVWVGLFYGAFFIFLFSDFYRTAYRKQAAAAAAAMAAAASTNEKIEQNSSQDEVTGGKNKINPAGGLDKAVQTAIVFGMSILIFYFVSKNANPNPSNSNYTTNNIIM